MIDDSSEKHNVCGCAVLFVCDTESNQKTINSYT